MVIFGLPTYEDVTLAHRAQCESLANSLRGLNAGMASHMAVSDVIEGIALFANYTTDGAEWNTFQSFWLNCPRSEKIDNSIQK
jgi:gamma-glutamylcysteine synthetase